VGGGHTSGTQNYRGSNIKRGGHLWDWKRKKGDKKNVFKWVRAIGKPLAKQNGVGVGKGQKGQPVAGGRNSNSGRYSSVLGEKGHGKALVWGRVAVKGEGPTAAGKRCWN